MMHGKMEQAWIHTSHVMYLIAETNRDPKKHASPFSPLEFNAYHQFQKRQRGEPKHSITVLKVFVSEDNQWDVSPAGRRLMRDVPS
jgi:hypothetical protein